MKFNPEEVALLHPDYLGFIFYERSKRNFNGPIPSLPKSIKKVGVFVNESIHEIISHIKEYPLDVIQLHGEETPEDIQQFKQYTTKEGIAVPEIWKVFSVNEAFSFEVLHAYEEIADAYLFDTKGTEYGGTGIRFNWNLLSNYPSQKPFFLSGGIGPEHVSAIKEFIQNNSLPLIGIDINSKFETSPGLKNISALKTFINEL